MHPAIQELRHKSQESGNTTGTTNTIDQSLMALDEKLETLAKDIKSINDAMEPFMQSSSTPTFLPNGERNETAIMLQKHATLVSDWESVQDESDTLREELKEDKWLTVFRTVTDQADGMMSSLEKAVNRCQVRLIVNRYQSLILTTLPGFYCTSIPSQYRGRFSFNWTRKHPAQCRPV